MASGQTETTRKMTYYSSMTRTIEVSCVHCGEPAGRVNLMDIGEAMMWIRDGKPCQLCREWHEDVC